MSPTEQQRACSLLVDRKFKQTYRKREHVSASVSRLCYDNWPIDYKVGVATSDKRRIQTEEGWLRRKRWTKVHKTEGKKKWNISFKTLDDIWNTYALIDIFRLVLFIVVRTCFRLLVSASGRHEYKQSKHTVELLATVALFLLIRFFHPVCTTIWTSLKWCSRTS